MTTYKGIKGLSIREIAGDPDPLATGDIWYSSVTAKIRGAKIPAGAWSTAADTNSSKHLCGCSGTADAGIAFAGNNGPFFVASEEYDGTSWAEGDDCNTARGRPAQNIGTQTAALFVGGRAPGNKAEVEEYNGTSWTESGDLPTGTERAGGAGIQTAGLAFAGRSGAGTSVCAETYEYDGSSWTDGGDYGVVAMNPFGFGTQGAAVGAGGYNSNPNIAEAYTYNGTAWTDDGNINTARGYGAAAGTSGTEGQIGGGTTGDDTASAVTEQYNGTSWTEVADLNTALYQSSGSGTNQSALSVAGVGLSQKVESWSQAVTASNFTSS